jgi:hypothetical protein
MAFFKNDPESVLAKAIDAERGVLNNLETQLDPAKLTAKERKNDASQARRSFADEKTRTEVEQKQIAAERRVTDTMADIEDSKSKIAGLEKQLAAAADHRVREGTHSVIVNKITPRFTTAIANATTALTELADVTAIMATFMLDANGLASFSLAAKNELQSPAEILTTLLKSYADGVLNGTERATLPQPESPRAPIPAPPALTRVYLVKDVRWSVNGDRYTHQRWTDCDLPPEIAAKALQIGAAVPIDDPIRKKQRGFAKRFKPKPEDCVSLNNEPVSDPRVTEPIQHTAFQVVPRGGPRTVAIPAAPETRSQDKPK